MQQCSSRHMHTVASKLLDEGVSCNVSLHALHSLHTGSHHDVCCSSPSDNSMAAVPDHYRWSFCPKDTLEFIRELLQNNPVCYVYPPFSLTTVCSQLHLSASCVYMYVQHSVGISQIARPGMYMAHAILVCDVLVLYLVAYSEAFQQFCTLCSSNEQYSVALWNRAQLYALASSCHIFSSWPLPSHVPPLSTLCKGFVGSCLHGQLYGMHSD